MPGRFANRPRVLTLDSRTLGVGCAQPSRTSAHPRRRSRRAVHPRGRPRTGAGAAGARTVEPAHRARAGSARVGEYGALGCRCPRMNFAGWGERTSSPLSPPRRVHRADVESLARWCLLVVCGKVKTCRRTQGGNEVRLAPVVLLLVPLCAGCGGAMTNRPSMRT